MNKTYVYLHHQGFDFYLSSRELTYEERYCAHCQEADELIGIFENEESLFGKLLELQSTGLTYLSCVYHI